MTRCTERLPSYRRARRSHLNSVWSIAANPEGHWFSCGQEWNLGFSLRRRWPHETMPATASSAPVLILLHGACLNQAMWNGVRRHLDSRWQILAVDLPGHGSLRNAHYTLAGAVETVAAAAHSVAPSRVLLVGDSLGGYSALVAAASIPSEQLGGLIIGGCSQNMMGKSLRELRLVSLMLRVSRALLSKSRLTSRVSKQLRGMGQAEPDVDAMVQAHLRLQAFPEAVSALAHVDFLPVVAAIEQPILFVNGDLDKGPVAQESAFVAAARHGSSHRFHCEHGVTLRRPAEFAEMVNVCAERMINKVSHPATALQ